MILEFKSILFRPHLHSWKNKLMRTISIIAMILAISIFSDWAAKAKDVELLAHAPERYVVSQGDTLWGVASRYLKDPRRWTEIWDINQKQIKNPNDIYPGDIIVLVRTTDGSSKLMFANEKATIKLSPKMRIEKLDIEKIPSIPSKKLEPFLSQPLAIEKNGLDQAPLILGSSDNRVILSAGDTVYVQNMPSDQGMDWQVFRAGKALIDPEDNDRVLGHEAVYLGDVAVLNFDTISSVKITHSAQEILKGDRLIPASALQVNDYIPRAPDFPIRGRIISVYGGVTEIGQNAIITLNKGLLDGLEVGHVLAVYRKSTTKLQDSKTIQLPDERIGLVFLFRVFDKVSYALVLHSAQAIKVLDAVQTP